MHSSELIIVAALYACLHLISPWAARLQAHRRATVSSLSAGLAASYIFLHLIPELDESGELLGPRIYLMLLVGLAAYFGIETWIHRKLSGKGGHADARLHLGIAAVYTIVLLFTFRLQPASSLALTLVYAISTGLHLMSGDVALQEDYGESFMARGRLVLVGAVLVGAALSFVRTPRTDVVDIITALLAGLMMFKVFRKELPEFRDVRYGAFVAGMGVFLAAQLALEKHKKAEAPKVSERGSAGDNSIP